MIFKLLQRGILFLGALTAVGFLLSVWFPLDFPSCSFYKAHRRHRHHNNHKHKEFPLSESRLLFPASPPQVPSYSGDDGRFHYDPSSSTRDCIISRTQGQRIAFETALLTFKDAHPSLRILIAIPVANSAKVIADMTTQLIHFTEMFGHTRVVLLFGIGPSDEDSTYYQISHTSEQLHSSKVLHRVQFTNDLEEWTERTLKDYVNEVDVAVVVRGVICATDLARLVIHTIENEADLTCSLDVVFSTDGLLTTSTENYDRKTGSSVPVEEMLRSPTFIQSDCCDGSVKALTFKSLRPDKLIEQSTCKRGGICLDNEFRSGEETCKMPAKVMISPSIKSSPDPDDFRSAIQLGFLDLQGFVYEQVEWE